MDLYFGIRGGLAVEHDRVAVDVAHVEHSGTERDGTPCFAVIGLLDDPDVTDGASQLVDRHHDLEEVALEVGFHGLLVPLGGCGLLVLVLERGELGAECLQLTVGLAELVLQVGNDGGVGLVVLLAVELLTLCRFVLRHAHQLDVLLGLLQGILEFGDRALELELLVLEVLHPAFGGVKFGLARCELTRGQRFVDLASEFPDKLSLSGEVVTALAILGTVVLGDLAEFRDQPLEPVGVCGGTSCGTPERTTDPDTGVLAQPDIDRRMISASLLAGSLAGYRCEACAPHLFNCGHV